MRCESDRQDRFGVSEEVDSSDEGPGPFADGAREADESRPYVAKVLSGDVNISFRTAAKFAHALQLDFFPVLKPMDESAAEPSPAPT